VDHACALQLCVQATTQIVDNKSEGIRRSGKKQEREEHIEPEIAHHECGTCTVHESEHVVCVS
jgi:hypothetical protein